MPCPGGGFPADGETASLVAASFSAKRGPPRGAGTRCGDGVERAGDPQQGLGRDGDDIKSGLNGCWDVVTG